MKENKEILVAYKTLNNLLNSKSDKVRLDTAKAILAIQLDVPVNKEDLKYMLLQTYNSINNEDDEERYNEIINEYKSWL